MMQQPQSIRVHLAGLTMSLAGLSRAIVRSAPVAAVALALLPPAAGAFPLTGGWNYSGAAPAVRVDWQRPWSLPPRFRNHCRYDPVRGRPYCANHCGPDYQFYFCSSESSGCCHPGYGYCDWKGHLRCAP
jgi:hypothetical protein